MATDKLDQVLKEIKSRLEEKDRKKMEGMTLGDLVKSAEFHKIVMEQKEVLEGIESMLTDLGKLDKLDDVLKAIKALKLEVNVPDRVTVRNFKDAPRPIIPRDMRIGNVDEMKSGMATEETQAQILKAVKSQKIEFPKDAKDAIPVRMSDGKKFIETMERVAETSGQAVKILGGGNSGQVFEKSDSSPVRPKTANVSGKEYVVVVNPDGTNVASDVSVSASVDTTGLATETKQDSIVSGLSAIESNQTDNTQVTQIVDASGNAVTVTDNKLDVNATASLAGDTIPVSGATEAVSVAIVDGSGDQITSFGGGVQYTEGDTDATITGTALMWEDAANTVVAASADRPLPVDLGANNDVTVTGTVDLGATDNAVLDDIASKLGTIDADTSTLAGVDYATDAKLDTIITNLGNIDTGKLEESTFTGRIGEVQASPTANTVLARLKTINDTIAAGVTVDLGANNDVTVSSSALPTGASTSAKQDTIIGHVDGIETVLGTIDTDTGNIATSIAAINAKMVTGTDIGDVTINNGAGAAAVNIQDGGNAITVDGTVTANLSATDNTVLDNIDTSTSTAATSLGVIDDWDNAASDGASVSGDVAHDAADAGEPVKIGGKAQSHLSDPAEVSAANDRVNTLFDRVGRMAVYQGYVLKSAVINTSTSGDNTIVAAVATKRIRVLAVAIVSDGTTDVRWESGASGTALTGQIPLQAREGYTISNPWGLFETTAVNTLLNLELTAAVNVHGWVTYIEVDD